MIALSGTKSLNSGSRRWCGSPVWITSLMPTGTPARLRRIAPAEAAIGSRAADKAWSAASVQIALSLGLRAAMRSRVA